jgi:hypothetical protein
MDNEVADVSTCMGGVSVVVLIWDTRLSVRGLEDQSITSSQRVPA